ncbi:MAG: hypothetical protein IJC04_06645 [Oscillospiraceae bacterium]|nr:hypothetical protein [Oscillospiraceae bacterium]
MFRKKIQRIFSTILAAIISISLLSACEKTESIPEETTISETTVATVPTDLTEEEMAIWESMPDIVTMRVYNDYETKTTEILYIEKSGAMKSFVSDEYYKGYKDSEWLSNKIKTSEADVTGEVDIYKLIEYYKLLLLIDENCPMKSRQFISQQIQREAKFSYEIYGKNNLNNTITFIAYKYASSENICDSLYGEELFDLYFEIDPFTTTNETIFLY